MLKKPMNILIKNALILPMDRGSGELYFRGNLGVSGGKISFVEEVCESGNGILPEGKAVDEFLNRCGGDVEIMDGTGKLVMPGLVNTHNHAPMTLMRGYADDIPLMKWLNEYVWPFERKLNGDDIKLGASLGIAEMLLGGTTTFVDMYWHQDRVAEAVGESGIRAVLSPTLTDSRVTEFNEDLSVLLEIAEEYPRITLMLAPHSVYTCSRGNLLYVKGLAEKHGLGINIHLSETLDEQAAVKQESGMTPVEYLDGLGLLDSSTLAVHAVHVDGNDMSILAERGVSISHNPHSNMKLASGIAPVGSMLAAGINVSVGTDGACSNNDLDMWEELRTASFLQKVSVMDPQVLPAYEVLKMATVNGAKAIGLGDRVGRLKPGMSADIIVLDIEKPHFYPRYDMIANLAYCAKASDVDTVIVDGKVVVANRRLLNADVHSLCAEADRRVREILKR